jgi:hypothetical protein
MPRSFQKRIHPTVKKYKRVMLKMIHDRPRGGTAVQSRMAALCYVKKTNALQVCRWRTLSWVYYREPTDEEFAEGLRILSTQ